MSPDSSYGRYDAPTPTDHNMMSPAHKEREPELHIGSAFTIIINLFIYIIVSYVVIGCDLSHMPLLLLSSICGKVNVFTEILL